LHVADCGERFAGRIHVQPVEQQPQHLVKEFVVAVRSHLAIAEQQALNAWRGVSQALRQLIP
jgi:hypothetical protein